MPDSSFKTAALHAIQKLYADTSVKREATKAMLEDIRDEVEQLLDTLSDVEAEDD